MVPCKDVACTTVFSNIAAHGHQVNKGFQKVPDRTLLMLHISRICPSTPQALEHWLLFWLDCTTMISNL
eukprot:scaffold414566_cov24-Prasinocladus_malaysianus.AAC.1